MASERLTGFVRSISPPPGLRRLLVVQTFSYSVGTGFYVAGSIVFFTTYTRLSASQVAIGVSIAGVVALLLRLPLGMLADRLGGRPTWLIGSVAQAVLFAAYPAVHGFAQFLIVVSLIGVASTLGAAGRGRYLGEVVAAGQRVKSNAYLHSVMNVAMALGTAAAGLVLAVDSRQVMVAVVLVNALSFVFDAALLAFFLPAGDGRSPRVEDAAHGRSALSERPFVVLSLLNGLLMMSDTVLVMVLPLWIITLTDAPRSTIPAVLLLNMAMVTLLQVRASRGSEDVPGAVRRQTLSGFWLAGACLLIPLSAYTSPVWTWVVLLAAAAVLTQGELYSSAAGWGLSYELSPEQRRGEYLAVFGWGAQFADIIGPAAMTALALTLVPWGWVIMAAVFLGAALATSPTVQWLLRGRADLTAHAREEHRQGPASGGPGVVAQPGNLREGEGTK